MCGVNRLAMERALSSDVFDDEGAHRWLTTVIPTNWRVCGGSDPAPRPKTRNRQPPRLDDTQHLVAPNLFTLHNTLRLALWVEIKLVTDNYQKSQGIEIFDERVPIKNELCRLHLADGSIREKRTDDDGLARFDGLPPS